MTVEEAQRFCQQYYNNSNPTEDDNFMYVEALSFLIKELGEPSNMMELGGYYYELKEFDLALKYYEMASSLDYEPADECLGYVWYYGRTGQRDYEKAFKYFERAAKKGNIVANYKVADMYKNGYFVEKDYDKYCQIIEDLYPRVKNARNLGEPLPEIFTRLAKIRTEQGQIEEAVSLYLYAKDFLAQRISYNPFFGNLTIMKWLIKDLYDLIEFDPDNMDLFDLYYLLKEPVQLRFKYNKKYQFIETSLEDGMVVINFNNKWYRTIDDFFSKAKIGDQRLITIFDRLKDFEVV